MKTTEATPPKTVRGAEAVKMEPAAESRFGPEAFEQEAAEWNAQRMAEARRVAHDRQMDLDAQLEAGLLDSARLSRYLELRREQLEEQLDRETRIDPAVLEPMVRAAEPRLSLGQRWCVLPPYAYFTSCWTWDHHKSDTPQYAGGFSHTEATSSADQAGKSMQFKLVAQNGILDAKHVSLATGFGCFLWTIPGSLVPHGRLQVTPFVQALGTTHVIGKADAFRDGASAFVSVQTHLQQVSAKSVSPEAKLWSLPGSGKYGFFADGLNQVGFVPGAAATLETSQGKDVMVIVRFALEARCVGHLCRAELYIEGKNRFVTNPFLGVKVLETYPPDVVELAKKPSSLIDELMIATLPADQLKKA